MDYLEFLKHKMAISSQAVPYCAVRQGRKGLSVELNHDYWHDGLTYLKEAESEILSPTLFDLMGMEEHDTVGTDTETA